MDDLIVQAMSLQTNLLAVDERDKIETEMRRLVDKNETIESASEAFLEWFRGAFIEEERRSQALEAASFDFQAFAHHRDVNSWNAPHDPWTD